MNKKWYVWSIVGIVILLSALVSGFILLQPSAEDVLVKTLETTKTINNAHAVVDVRADTIEKDVTATIEIWGRHGEDGPGSFRLEVLETSDQEAAGAVAVSDGESLWAFVPSKGKVFVGTLDQAQNLMAEKQLEMGELEKGDYEHPENAEAAVQKLLEYFTVDKQGSEEIAGESATHLKFAPIPEQMPSEYAAVGGFVNLWIDQARNVPLAVEYTGGSMGEISATILELDINAGVEEALFTFEMPADVEVVPFADLAPESLSLDEAADAAEFELLTPAETLPGATLVDLLDVRDTIVQRYTLPEGGSFTVAQGISDEAPQPSTEGQTVEVRSVDGALFTSEDGTKVLLVWTEGQVFYAIAGDLTAEQALTIAESLK
jgi:outer membrane lipoprotein-sorting protein